MAALRMLKSPDSGTKKVSPKSSNEEPSELWTTWRIWFAQFSEKPTPTTGAWDFEATSMELASSPLMSTIPSEGTMFIRRRKLVLISSRLL